MKKEKKRKVYAVRRFKPRHEAWLMGGFGHTEGVLF